MKRNIFIFGEPRCGKSTLTDMISEKFGYHIIRSDCERDSFNEIFPELKINPETTVTNQRFQLYLKSLIANYQMEGREKYGIVLEGSNTSVADCHKLFNDGNNIIYYLGPLDITPEEFAETIQQHDTELDWTYNFSRDELITYAKRFIERAQQYKKQCDFYGIKFVDTSKNREQVLSRILSEIEQELLDNESKTES